METRSVIQARKRAHAQLYRRQVTLRWLPRCAAAIGASLLVAVLALVGTASPQLTATNTFALGLFTSSQNPATVLSDAQGLGVTVQAMTAFGYGSNSCQYTAPSTSLQLQLAVGPCSTSQAATVGNALVAGGHANASIRIDWEQNANWFSWGTNNSASTQISQFCTAANALEAVPNNHFAIVWNINAGTVEPGRSEHDAYPGNNCHIDREGLDFYDGFGADPAVSNDVAFAQSKGLPVEFDEWGLNGQSGSKPGDDPAFIDFVSGLAHNASNHVALVSYFDDDASIQSDFSHFPKSAAEFGKDFGGSGGGTTTTTQPVSTTTSSSTTTPHPVTTTSTTTTTQPTQPTTTTTQAGLNCTGVIKVVNGIVSGTCN